MKTFDMEFLGESEANDKSEKTACERILEDFPESATSTIKNNLPWIVAAGFGLLWITKRGKK